MKKIIVFSLLFLTFASLTTRPAINIQIPNSVAAGALVTVGTLTGAFSILAGKSAYDMLQEQSSNNGLIPQKSVLNMLTVGSGLAAITSGIVSYLSFKNAYNLLK